MKLIATTLAAAVLLSGCATKDFGRLHSVGNVAAMNCAELADAQAEVDAFRAAIDDKDDWDARTLVASTLLDFGFGNMRDKKRALRTADARDAEIASARRAAGCGMSR